MSKNKSFVKSPDAVVLGVLFLLAVAGGIYFRSSKVQNVVEAIVVTSTNSYEEIGWMTILDKGIDQESHCVYVVVSTNNTSDPNTFEKCWADSVSFPAMLRDINGTPQAYILKVNNSINSRPSFVVKWDAKSTRINHQ